jgi:hypothetical protein
MKSILDPSFRYTASFNTNLRNTFARVRRDQRREVASVARATQRTPDKVSSIVGRTVCNIAPRASINLARDRT